MSPEILYCGDTHLRSAAAYLAGLLTAAGLPFRYVSSDQPLAESDPPPDLKLLILSDYPSARVSHHLQRRIVSRVEQGMGLLMIGGWESYHGLGGDWDTGPLAEILPVEMRPSDDRLNSDRPLLARRVGSHAVTDNLPWEQSPPYVGGLNRVQPRRGGRVLLEVDRLAAVREGSNWRFRTDETYPLLIAGEHGRGRTATLATDVAPHWVGGLVDWGPGRVTAQAEQADAVEVGNLYAQFLTQLIRWTKGE